MKTKMGVCVLATLDEREQKSYFEKFGQTYWNDSEGIVCIPVKYLREIGAKDYLAKLETFFNVCTNLIDYIIWSQ